MEINNKKKKKIDQEKEAKRSIKSRDRIDELPSFRKISDTFNADEVIAKNFVPRGTKKNCVALDSFNDRQPNGPEFLSAQAPLYPSSIPEKVLRFYGERYFIGWNACSMIVQHPQMSLACSLPGEDAIAVGYSVKSIGQTKIKSSMLKDFIYISNKINLDDSLRKLDFNKRAFGSSLAVPCFKEDIDMSNELMDYSILKDKTLIGWTIIDPYWTVPKLDEKSLNDPSYIDYMKPTYWMINGENKIHKSWCVHVVNTIVPDILKPVYWYGGISLTQMAYERLYSADKVANEAHMLAMSKRTLVLEENIKKMANNQTYAQKVLDNLTYNRDNWGVVLVPPNTKVQQLDTYITEFNQLITTQYQLFCSICQIPASKLMMVPLTGFASTGVYEWKIYAQTIKQVQENEFKRLLKKHYRILAATKGVFDCDFDIDFNEVDALSLMEQSEIILNEAKAKYNRDRGNASMELARADKEHKSLKTVSKKDDE